MSAVQLTFDMRDRKARAKAGPKLAARMISILAVKRCWMKRKDFARYGLTDRQCRLGRECAHGRILQGQSGYKLMRYATPEEILEARMAIHRQIIAEQKQLDLLTRRAHEALHKRGVA